MRFTISTPRTVEAVLDELSADPEACALYAGGTELLLAMKQGLMAPERLIDIKGVNELKHLTLSPSGETLDIGARTTHLDVLRSGLVATTLPILPMVIRRVANVRVRSVGTLVGNLCFAEPHSDVSTLVTLLGGQVRVTGDRSRWVAVDDFIVDAYETTLAPDELVTSLRLPVPGSGTLFGYRRFKGTERPLAVSAVALTIEDRMIREARVCIGAIGGRPCRPQNVEGLLTGAPVDRVRSLLAEGAHLVAAEVEAVDDYEASEHYRRHLAAELFVRAISDALNQYEEVR